MYSLENPFCQTICSPACWHRQKGCFGQLSELFREAWHYQTPRRRRLAQARASSCENDIISFPAAPDIVLPQGGDGNDVLTVAGERVYADVCPASSLPPRLTLFSFAGRRRRRLLHGLLHRHHRGGLREHPKHLLVCSCFHREPPARLTKLEFNQHYNSPRRLFSRSVTWCL